MDKIVTNVDNDYKYFNWSIPTLVLSVIVVTITCIEILCRLVLKSSFLYYIADYNSSLSIITLIIAIVFAIIGHYTHLFKKREYKISRNLYKDFMIIIFVLLFTEIILNIIGGVYYG